MKNILTALTLTLITLISAQNPITKTVGEFDTVKAYDLINVELIQSDENKVEITGDNASDVVVVNKNGTLKIRMSVEESFDGNKTYVKLYYTGAEILDANEGAYISSQDQIKQHDLELKTQEGGHIKLKVEVRNIEARAFTGGIVELSGDVHYQNIKVNTGGSFESEDLKSVTSKVKIEAGGVVKVNASELVDIRIRAGGDVYVYGDPETVNEDKIVGGRVKRM